MPRYRGYDIIELRAFWETGNYQSAPEVMEAMGIDRKHLRGVQATILKLYGRRPTSAARAMREDWLKRAVVKSIVAAHDLRGDYCAICQKYCGSDVYLRQLSFDGDLTSVVVVGKCCKRAGDY